GRAVKPVADSGRLGRLVERPLRPTIAVESRYRGSPFPPEVPMRSIPAVLVSLTAVIAAVANAQDTGTTAIASGMIQLTDELDEAEDGEWYCFDSFGDTVEEGDGIQVHTCKDRPEGVSEDQDWTPNSPNMGQLETTQSPGLCVQAQRIAAGAWVNVLP